MFNLYFDESSHDRAITYKKDQGLNIYFPFKNDLFVGFFWGFKEENELRYQHQYSVIEKYLKSLYGLNENQEFKGSIVKQKNFEFGFNSFKPNTLKVYSQLFDFLDNEDFIFHLHLYSKTEYLITQYFRKVEINIIFGEINKKAFIYSIIKFLFNYRNENFLAELFSNDISSPVEVIEKLKSILETVINNITNVKRKEKEIPALKEMLIILNNSNIIANPKEKYKWAYEPVFIGLSKLLKERGININTINLRIDPEGTNSIVNTARKQGFNSVSDDEDSSENGLIRVADLVSNLFYRLTLALQESLKEEPFVNPKEHDYATKHILNKNWFDIENEEVYQLYVSLNRILKINGRNYWTIFSGIYFDYALLTVSLLEYFSEKYKSYNDFISVEAKEHAEYFNTFLSEKIQKEFEMEFSNVYK